jgi:nitroreductase
MIPPRHTLRDMELHVALTTTPATRTFTDDPVSDAEIFRLLDVARFAPNGGNRQGWHVLVIRDPATREAVVEASAPVARRYVAQKAAGENPLNTIHPSEVDAATIEATELPAWTLEHYRTAPVLLMICVDLAEVASVDADLDRIGVISGASIYPFVWNILLAARNEGYGGTITTMVVAEEPAVRELLGVPESYAVAAVLPMGKPQRQVKKLKRDSVAELVTRERFDGEPFGH